MDLTRDSTWTLNDRNERWRKHVREPASLYLTQALQFLFAGEDDGPGTIRVRRWDRLYRLLALGPAEYLTEVGDLKRLVADLDALESALSTDDASALSILRGIQEYISQLQIADLPRFLDRVTSASAKRLASGDGNWRQLANEYGEVIEQSVRLDRKNHEQLLDRVIDDAPLSVSQLLLANAARDLGLWPLEHRPKVKEDERLVPAPECYERLRSRWLSRVTSGASSPEFMLEPMPYGILYAWGLLSGDYEPARSVAEALVKHYGQLVPFMRACRLLDETTPEFGYLDLIWDREDLIGQISGDPNNGQRYSRALDVLRSEDVRDYFSKRSCQPTLRWPPDASNC